VVELQGRHIFNNARDRVVVVVVFYGYHSKTHEGYEYLCHRLSPLVENKQ